MKLNELYHKLEDKTFAEYLETLLKSNVAKIASGKFATVVIPHAKSYVYKVWISDPSYEKWIDFCKKNTNNKDYGSLLPKFVKGTSIINVPFSRNTRYKDAQLKVQRIEKLRPSDNYNYLPFEVFFQGSAFDTHESMLEYFYSQSKRITAIDIDDITSEDDLENADKEPILEDMRKLWSLFKTIPSHNFGTFDGHTGNFMFRPNGELVLTDIFCNIQNSVSIGELSWDGTNLPQGKHSSEPGFDPDQDEEDPINVVAPDDKSNPRSFIKGRNGKLDWTKKSKPPEIVNWLRFHDISELMSNDDFVEELNGNVSLIVALSDQLSAYDHDFYIELLAGVLTQLPSNVFNEHEDAIIENIVRNQRDDLVENYLEEHGDWPALFTAAAEEGWDIPHLEP